MCTVDIVKADNLACPFDGLPLKNEARQWFCPQGHNFDEARQGYINLLPVQQKRSKNPGDSKAMVQARTQFLDTGLYAPIAEKMACLIADSISGQEKICILDAGCGEGYYLDYIFNVLIQHDGRTKLAFAGLDISKQAILQASKRNRSISWIVASNRQPPLLADSVDIILCIFGFVSFEGFKKVLKPGGRIILVDPGPDHLRQLREIIYSRGVLAKTDHGDDFESDNFVLVDTRSCRFTLDDIDNDKISHLLQMTPHLFRADKAGKQAAYALQSLTLTIDVVIRTLQRR